MLLLILISFSIIRTLLGVLARSTWYFPYFDIWSRFVLLNNTFAGAPSRRQKGNHEASAKRGYDKTKCLWREWKALIREDDCGESGRLWSEKMTVARVEGFDQRRWKHKRLLWGWRKYVFKSEINAWMRNIIHMYMHSSSFFFSFFLFFSFVDVYLQKTIEEWTTRTLFPSSSNE